MTMANTPSPNAASADRPKGPFRNVAVFGAGIAGLSAAHELIRHGYDVSIYEATREAGGFFRSARLDGENETPSEYSWHGMGPWYHNLFDLLQNIPFDELGSIYDRALSRPIDFGIFPERGTAHFFDCRLRSIPAMFEMTRWDLVKWSWLMLKTWASNKRTERHYSTFSAAEEWGAILSHRCHTCWKACFGPWIGSDWTRVSLHTAGQFFRKQLSSRPTHFHRADAEGPAWRHGQGDGWLLFRGPSSEYWFNRWVKHLIDAGAKFFWQSPLMRLQVDGNSIKSAELENGAVVRADCYILAIDPFSAAQVVARSPGLEETPEMRLFRPLVQDGPHTQVSFRIAFAEPIQFPRKRTAIVLADTEFNLTLFAEELVWDSNVALGENVKSLWTGTSCTATYPGRVYGLPVIFCTKDQFIEEIKAQILACQSLDAFVREANDGRSLKSFTIAKIEVWHEWRFSSSGIQHLYPKWVTTTHTQAFQPSQTTAIRNLFLAGAHTKTEADVWSIEGAVESGRRAAKAIDPRISVISQYTPLWLKVLSLLDDVCYFLNGPHILVVLLWALGLLLLYFLFHGIVG